MRNLNRCTLPPMVARRSTVSPATSSKAGQWYLNPHGMASSVTPWPFVEGSIMGMKRDMMSVCIVGICHICIYIYVYSLYSCICCLSLSPCKSLCLTMYAHILNHAHTSTYHGDFASRKKNCGIYTNNAICSHNTCIYIPVKYWDSSWSYQKEYRKFIAFQLQQPWIQTTNKWTLTHENDDSTTKNVDVNQAKVPMDLGTIQLSPCKTAPDVPINLHNWSTGEWAQAKELCIAPNLKEHKLLWDWILEGNVQLRISLQEVNLEVGPSRAYKKPWTWLSILQLYITNLNSKVLVTSSSDIFPWVLTPNLHVAVLWVDQWHKSSKPS